MVYSGKKSYVIPAVIVSLIVLFLILNALIKPDLSIKTFCEVFPKEKWLLTRGPNGQIVSSMENYENGRTVQYSLNYFERGEYISLKFFPGKEDENFINKGDTVILIQSSDVDEQLIGVQGELQVARATLAAQSSGEKLSLIKEAEARLDYTNKRIDEQKILFDRIKSLFEKKLASQQDYDSQKTIVDLLAIEKKMYEAQLQNLTTGVKPEEINLVKSQIKSIESRLELLRNRKNDLAVVSPISGFPAKIFSPDTLITLINDKEIILHIPVKVEDIDLFQIGQIININFSTPDIELPAKVVSIPREVKFLNSQQVILVTVKMQNPDGKFLPGMVKESFLGIKKISLFEYLVRFISI